MSVPNVHWTNGAVIDLEAVADRTHELGARLMIDASQSAGALEIDVERLRPDFLVSVGYKWLLGPFALGYLWVGPDQRDGAPIEQNWILREGARDFSRLVDYRDSYEPGARRFDVGQRTNFQLVPMAIASLEQLLEWEVARIGATLAETTGALADGAAELGLEPVAGRRPGAAPARDPADRGAAPARRAGAARGGLLRRPARRLAAPCPPPPQHARRGRAAARRPRRDRRD